MFKSKEIKYCKLHLHEICSLFAISSTNLEFIVLRAWGEARLPIQPRRHASDGSSSSTCLLTRFLTHFACLSSAFSQVKTSNKQVNPMYRANIAPTQSQPSVHKQHGNAKERSQKAHSGGPQPPVLSKGEMKTLWMLLISFLSRNKFCRTCGRIVDANFFFLKRRLWSTRPKSLKWIDPTSWFKDELCNLFGQGFVKYGSTETPHEL